MNRLRGRDGAVREGPHFRAPGAAMTEGWHREQEAAAETGRRDPPGANGEGRRDPERS